MVKGTMVNLWLTSLAVLRISTTGVYRATHALIHILICFSTRSRDGGLYGVPTFALASTFQLFPS